MVLAWSDLGLEALVVVDDAVDLGPVAGLGVRFFAMWLFVDLEVSSQWVLLRDIHIEHLVVHCKTYVPFFR